MPCGEGAASLRPWSRHPGYQHMTWMGEEATRSRIDKTGRVGEAGSRTHPSAAPLRRSRWPRRQSWDLPARPSRQPPGGGPGGVSAERLTLYASRTPWDGPPSWLELAAWVGSREVTPAASCWYMGRGGPGQRLEFRSICRSRDVDDRAGVAIGRGIGTGAGPDLDARVGRLATSAMFQRSASQRPSRLRQPLPATCT